MSQDLKEIASMLDEVIAAGELELLAESLVFSVFMSGAVLAVFFVLRAIGLYRLNRRLGNKGAFLAFIPGLSGYALGAAADSLQGRKPTNFCIHMLMVDLFSLIANGVYYFKTFGRFLLLYETLRVGGTTDTLALLEKTMVGDASDPVFLIAYYATNLLNYVVLMVSFLCYRRVLHLYRSERAFFLLVLAIFVPQVMSVYLFAVRNREIHRKPFFEANPFDRDRNRPDSWEEHYDTSDRGRNGDTDSDKAPRDGDGSDPPAADAADEDDRRDTDPADQEKDDSEAE